MHENDIWDQYKYERKGIGSPIAVPSWRILADLSQSSPFGVNLINCCCGLVSAWESWGSKLEVESIGNELEELHAKKPFAKDFYHHFHRHCPRLGFNSNANNDILQRINLVSGSWNGFRLFTEEMLSTMQISLKFWVLLKTTFGPNNPENDGTKALYWITISRCFSAGASGSDSEDEMEWDEMISERMFEKRFNDLSDTETAGKFLVREVEVELNLFNNRGELCTVIEFEHTAQNVVVTGITLYADVIDQPTLEMTKYKDG